MVVVGGRILCDSFCCSHAIRQMHYVLLCSLTSKDNDDVFVDIDDDERSEREQK